MNMHGSISQRPSRPGCARWRRGSPKPLALPLLLLGMLVAASVQSRELLVGPGRALQKPSQAARVARNGDHVLIDAGVYRRDAAVWRANGLRIRAVGGPVVLRADGAHAQGKGTWVIAGRDTEIEGIAFEGAAVPDGNGAGIRHQGVGLTIRRCRFEDNQMGLLSGHKRDDEILIEESVFARNGPGPGPNHNLYVGRIAKLVVRGSSLHHARVGHNVKSRARVTHLLYNRIMDEADGNSSYAVDIPHGGDALLVGNLVQQGPLTENWALVSFGAQGRHHKYNRLRMAHNTLVNDAPDGIFVHVHPGQIEVSLVNNLMVGAGKTYVGVNAKNARDVRLVSSPFLDAASFDYRLRDDPTVVDRAVALPPGMPRPEWEYRHTARLVARPVVGKAPDVGALERR